uniref:Uncharacterized protein n=1 Tax=Loxodonta africana TaxID=9785 RepID=G3TU25_LOXAF
TNISCLPLIYPSFQKQEGYRKVVASWRTEHCESEWAQPAVIYCRNPYSSQLLKPTPFVLTINTRYQITLPQTKSLHSIFPQHTYLSSKNNTAEAYRLGRF